MAFCLMVFYENLNLTFLGWSIRSVCKPIAEQLTILMIFTLILTTQTFDYVILKKKIQLIRITKITIH